jgi:hypothetical protein
VIDLVGIIETRPDFVLDGLIELEASEDHPNSQDPTHDPAKWLSPAE